MCRVPAGSRIRDFSATYPYFIMRVIKKHEGERGLKGNGAAVCVGLGSALCQVVQGRCGGPSDLG